MLTYNTAFDMVRESIADAGATKGVIHVAVPLADLGLSASGTLEPLIQGIVNRVQDLQQEINPMSLHAVVRSSITVDELTNHVMRLSAGKLCTNPNNPHEQTCCPYPATCPQCGFPV